MRPAVGVYVLLDLIVFLMCTPPGSSTSNLVKSSRPFPPTCHRGNSPHSARTAQGLLLHRIEHSLRRGLPLDTSAAAASGRLPAVATSQRTRRFESALRLRSANERHLVKVARETDPAERNAADRFHRKTGCRCHRGGKLECASCQQQGEEVLFRPECRFGDFWFVISDVLGQLHRGSPAQYTQHHSLLPLSLRAGPAKLDGGSASRIMRDEKQGRDG